MKKRIFAIATMLLLLLLGGCDQTTVIPVVEDIIYSHDLTLADVNLPDGYKWFDETIHPNAGYTKFTATFEENGISQSVQIEINVLQGTPVIYETPEIISDDLKEGDKLPLCTGKTNVEGSFSWYQKDYTLKMGNNEIGWTFTPVDKNYKSLSGIINVLVGRNVIINVNPKNANVLVLNGTEQINPINNVYHLEENLEYTYYVSKQGYYEKTGLLPLKGGIINIELEKEPKINIARREAIKEIEEYLDKSLYEEEQIKEIDEIIISATSLINKEEQEENIKNILKDTYILLDNVFTKEQMIIGVPKIRTNIESGKTYNNKNLNLELEVSDQEGTQLPSKNVSVLLNKEEVELFKEDGKLIYKLDLKDYNNEVIIKVTNGPIEREFKYNFFFEELPSKVTLLVETFSTGSSFIVEPINITLDGDYLTQMATHFKMDLLDLKEKLNAAYLVVYILETNNYEVSYSGTLDKDFKLEKISGFENINQVQAELLLKLEELGIELKKSSNNNSLSNNDLTNKSMWIATINSNLVKDSLSNIKLEDGSLIRIGYSIYDGKEYEQNSWFIGANKDNLIYCIKDAIAANLSKQEDYLNAYNVLVSFKSNQYQVDKALAELETAISVYKDAYIEREKASQTLEKHLDINNYYPNEQNLIKEQINKAKASLDNEFDKNEMQKIVKQTIVILDGIKTKEQVEQERTVAQRKDAIEFLENYADPYMYEEPELSAIKELIREAKKLINAATDANHVDEIVALTMDKINIIPKLEDKIQDDIVLSVSFLNEQVIHNAEFEFDVKAFSVDGTKISPDFVKVTVNSNEPELIWDDQFLSTYFIKLEEGPNEILIIVECEFGYAEYNYVVFYEQQDQVIYFSIEAFTLGLDYVLMPKQIVLNEEYLVNMAEHFGIYDPEEMKNVLNVAYLLIYELDNNGLSFDIYGDPAYDLYLEAIHGFDHSAIYVPDDLKYILEEHDIYVEEDVENPDSLREHDHTKQSRWQFSVNNKLIRKGLSEKKVQDGDIIRIQFSLCDGFDLGYLTEDDTWFEPVNKDQLTKVMALMVEQGLTDLSEFEEALNVLRSPVSHQSECDELTSILQDIIDLGKDVLDAREDASYFIGSYLNKKHYRTEEVKQIDAIIRNARSLIYQATSREQIDYIVNENVEKLDRIPSIDTINAMTPVIKVSVPSGETLYERSLELTVNITDGIGNLLKSNSLTAVLNGKELKPMYLEKGQLTYNLLLNAGLNSLTFTCTNEDITTTLNVEYIVELPEVPFISVSVEAFTIGNGYVVEPFKLDLTEPVLKKMADKFGYASSEEMLANLRVSHVIIYVLEEKGLSFESSGQVLDGFNIHVINGFNHKNNIPISILAAMEERGISYKAPNDFTHLGELDYSSQSKWIVTKNNNLVTNLGATKVSEGDVIRLQFSLCNGKDLVLVDGQSYFDIVDKDYLTTLLALANSKGLSESPAYKNAYEVCINFNSKSKDIDKILPDLEAIAK